MWEGHQMVVESWMSEWIDEHLRIGECMKRFLISIHASSVHVSVHFPDKYLTFRYCSYILHSSVPELTILEFQQ